MFAPSPVGEGRGEGTSPHLNPTNSPPGAYAPLMTAFLTF